MTRQAAQKNWTVLQSFNGNLQDALAAQQKTQLGYGSEFRQPEILEPLFPSHVLWPNMKDILTNGATFPLEPLDEELRKKDLVEALTMGNHKGAMKQPQVLENFMAEDAFRGYSLPAIPLEKVIEIDGAIMAPQNVARQNTIDETGQIIEKDQLTHDQSWKFSSGALLQSTTAPLNTKSPLFNLAERSAVSFTSWSALVNAIHPNASI
eukprot:scaffold30875_cov50-Attheya_sp.AAC.5